jgi:hypothetical protein
MPHVPFDFPPDVGPQRAAPKSPAAINAEVKQGQDSSGVEWVSLISLHLQTGSKKLQESLSKEDFHYQVEVSS